MNGWINLGALWKIVVVGLLAGAGLPAVFAVGIRALAIPGRPKKARSHLSHVRSSSGIGSAGLGGHAGPGGTSSQVASGPHPVATTPDDHVMGTSALGLAVGVLCFAVVLAAIGTGIYLIVTG